MEMHWEINYHQHVVLATTVFSAEVITERKELNIFKYKGIMPGAQKTFWNGEFSVETCHLIFPASRTERWKSTECILGKLLNFTICTWLP